VTGSVASLLPIGETVCHFVRAGDGIRRFAPPDWRDRVSLRERYVHNRIVSWYRKAQWEVRRSSRLVGFTVEK